MMIYYVLIFLISILGSVGLYFLLKKYENKKTLILKCLSVLIGLVNITSPINTDRHFKIKVFLFSYFFNKKYKPTEPRILIRKINT